MRSLGSRNSEHTGHLLDIEIALVPHDVFEIGELAVVDEQHQFARLGEVGLRRQERHRIERGLTLPCQESRSDRQQRAAQT